MKKFIVILLLSLSLCPIAQADVYPNKKTAEKLTQEKPNNLASTTSTDEAESPISGNFDITSNYVWRGVSLSNNLPAFQGGLTYTFLTTGIYLNMWGSNVNFPDAEDGTATVEIDTVGGIANKIGEHFGYDISIARYNYPKASGVNYNELLTKWSYYFLTAELDYSNNVFNTDKSGTYYNIGFNYGIPPKYIFNFNDVNVKGSIGHFSLPRSADLRSYNDYSLQINKTIGIYNLALQWTGTNGRSVDDPALRGNHLLGTVTVNF
ncbi:MAG: TorF family putative porin [Gammaproteobacteria bacterium]|nr:TorF family putative porin [Gammaproteobacteria bacterium]